jgi:DNA-binding XRE family transcriptional regulator
VYLEPESAELVVGFVDGSRIRVSLESLELPPGPTIAFAYPDEFGAGLWLAREDGTVEDVAADYILYKTDPAYHAAQIAVKEEPLREVIARQLTRIRAERHLSLREMAKVLGMAPSNYARLEKGSHTPSTSTLEGIAARLQLPLDRLVQRTG